MNAFQKTYLLMFIISLFGIVGNIEVNLETPMIWKIILITTGILTVGKLIYLETKGE